MISKKNIFSCPSLKERERQRTRERKRTREKERTREREREKRKRRERRGEKQKLQTNEICQWTVNGRIGKS